MSPLVTVVVCTYNRASSLRSALESLFALRTNGKFGYEILVVDDGSTDSTTEIVRSFENDASVELRYTRQEHSGVAAARNQGVRCAHGEWVAFFDDDQLATGEWLSSLMQAAEAANADCVGGPCKLVLPANNKLAMTPTIQSLLGQNPLMLEGRLRGRSRIDPRRQTVPGTGNALVRKDLFERIGMFSHAQRHGEDLEFFTRAQQSGARFAVASDAIVYHVIPQARLTPEYLLALAAKNGRSGGEIDARVAGMRQALWIAAMRLLHLYLWTIPILILHLVAGNQSRLLSSRCAGRYAIQYIAAVSKAASQQLLRRPLR